MTLKIARLHQSSRPQARQLTSRSGRHRRWLRRAFAQSARRDRRSTGQDRSRPGSISASSDNRDEWAKPGLHIREKKDEPVETAQALARRRWRLARLRFRGQHRITAAARRPAAVVINRVGRGLGQAREQAASPKSLVDELQRLQAAQCAEHHDWRIFLVFRRRRHLILCQLERNAVALVGDAPEMQRVPVDDDFSTADAKKAAKSTTAARTEPARSTITSTIRPMSSSVGLRTSRPSIPCASLAPMIVTEPPADAPMSPRLSSMMRVSSYLSERRGLAAGPVIGM